MARGGRLRVVEVEGLGACIGISFHHHSWRQLILSLSSPGRAAINGRQLYIVQVKLYLCGSDQRESRFSRILENFFENSLLDLDFESFDFHFHFSISILSHLIFTFTSRKE